MKQYQQLVARAIHGDEVPDRTGVGTRSVFGHQMRFDLNEGFPLVTIKRTFWRGAFVEMMWFLRGDTNVKWLHEHGVHIWDEWCTEGGELGPVYGSQWRRWSGPYGIEVDQIADLTNSLRNRPHSRRHIINAWNVAELPDETLTPQQNATDDYMALAPCHCLVQFHVSSDGRLSCQVYQRSADIFLGVPFNIAGYALLTHLLAHHLGYKVGDLIWTGGDCHLYSNHIGKAVEMLARDPLPMPTLILDHEPERPLWEVEPHECRIVGYAPHPAITAEVAV